MLDEIGLQASLFNVGVLFIGERAQKGETHTKAKEGGAEAAQSTPCSTGQAGAATR